MLLVLWGALRGGGRGGIGLLFGLLILEILKSWNLQILNLENIFKVILKSWNLESWHLFTKSWSLEALKSWNSFNLEILISGNVEIFNLEILKFWTSFNLQTLKSWNLEILNFDSLKSWTNGYGGSPRTRRDRWGTLRVIREVPKGTPRVIRNTGGRAGGRSGRADGRARAAPPPGSGK